MQEPRCSHSAPLRSREQEEIPLRELIDGISRTEIFFTSAEDCCSSQIVIGSIGLVVYAAALEAKGLFREYQIETGFFYPTFTGAFLK